MQKTNLNLYSVGDVVRVRTSFGSSPAGSLAYVYESYRSSVDSAGVSLITDQGIDLGGFCTQEQAEYLEPYATTNFYYSFRSVIRLADDWNRGAFAQLFHPDGTVTAYLATAHSQYIATKI
jgi:hypothetical protein